MAQRWHPSKCKSCGKTRTDAEPISARGYCGDCGPARMQANNLQLHAHSGPHFDYWRRRCLASFGVTLLDDREQSA